MFWWPAKSLISEMSAPALPLDTRLATTQDQSGFAIVFDQVHLSFEENEVLRGVSFRLPFGETKALFGVAGSGKSVLLKLALGLLKSDSGRITVLGSDITQMREEDLFQLRGKIGMVFQESALFDSLTVRENVAFRLLEEQDYSDEEIERRVREALRFVELELHAHAAVDLERPTSVLEVLASARVLHDTVQRHKLRDDDLPHVGPPVRWQRYRIQPEG